MEDYVKNMEKYSKMPYRQNMFGACSWFCLANIFGKHYLDEISLETRKKGTSLFEINKALEKHEQGFVLSTDTQIEGGFPMRVLKKYHYFKTDHEGFLGVAMATVASNAKGYNHNICILLGYEYCYLVDPLLDYVYKTTIYKINKLRPLISMEFFLVDGRKGYLTHSEEFSPMLQKLEECQNN